MIRQLLHAIRPRAGADHRPVPSAADRQLVDQMALGLAYLLDRAECDAQALAHSVLMQRQRLRTLPAVVPAAGAVVQRSLQAALERGPCLLALPWSVAGIELVRGLSICPDLHLVLVEPPVLRVLRAEIPLARRALSACAPRDAVKQARLDAARQARTVYVSFPELHPLGAGTTAPVTLLGKPCRLSMLDALLCTSSLDLLFTLDPDGRTLLALDVAAERAQGQGKAIRTCLDWLVAALQAAAVAQPAATLSWHHLYRTTLHCYGTERDNQLKQLEAYFVAWKRSSAGMPDQLGQLASARIAALRGAGPH